MNAVVYRGQKIPDDVAALVLPLSSPLIAPFKAVSFDGKKMTATYDFPPDEQAEIVLAATFDGNTATGTWSAREKANGNEVARGTWTVTRK